MIELSFNEYMSSMRYVQSVKIGLKILQFLIDIMLGTYSQAIEKKY